MFQPLYEEMKKHVPKLTVAYKDQSRFMWFLSKILFFVSGFMTRFTTTIGSTVYFVSEAVVKENPDQYAEVLSHEFVHAYDDSQHPVWFKSSYLLPQLLAVFALVALLSIWFSNLWLLSLLALGFLAPIPAYFRMKWEVRGYVMSQAFAYWRWGVKPDPKRHVNRFTTWAYYMMWPFAASMEARFNAELTKVLDGSVLSDPPYKVVRDFLVAHDLSAVQ